MLLPGLIHLEGRPCLPVPVHNRSQRRIHTGNGIVERVGQRIVHAGHPDRKVVEADIQQPGHWL